MISRLPRVVYAALPDGQDWTTSTIGDETVILINELLDERGRRRARKAAHASLRTGGPQAWLPLPVVVAGGWIGRKARSPFGSAMLASVVTAGAVYGLVGPGARDEPPRLADPPVIVTIHQTPAPASTRHATARPTRTRPSVSAGASRTVPPVRSTRSTSPPGTPPPRTTPPAATTPQPSQPVEDGGQETAEPALTPPPQPPTEEAEAPADPPTTAPTLEQAAASCRGSGLDVRVDPVLDVDACLLG